MEEGGGSVWLLRQAAAPGVWSQVQHTPPMLLPLCTPHLEGFIQVSGHNFGALPRLLAARAVQL